MTLVVKNDPRLTAFYSQEPKMYQAFKEGKDLYSVIAQNIYNNNYEDNLEFYPEGTKIVVNGEEVICGYKTHQNKAGKERRKHGKTLLLALTYGMGAKSVGESINKTEKEGQELMDNFFKAFPKVKQWIDYNDKFVKEYEYVEDFYGRRRHLKDINAPLYSAIYADKDKEALSSFNPYLICENKMSDELVSWIEKAKTTRGKKAFNELKSKAYENGILLINNSTKISNAKRQTTNSRVQGGAATITKIAMNNIYRDKELNDLGFRLLITVHDEVLGECPKRNAEAVQKRLAQVMVDSAKPYLDVPMACDCYVVPCWYYDELTTQVQEEVEKLVNGDKDKNIAPITREEAIKKIREKHIELLDEQNDNYIPIEEVEALLIKSGFYVIGRRNQNLHLSNNKAKVTLQKCFCKYAETQDKPDLICHEFNDLYVLPSIVYSILNLWFLNLLLAFFGISTLTCT